MGGCLGPKWGWERALAAEVGVGKALAARMRVGRGVTQTAAKCGHGGELDAWKCCAAVHTLCSVMATSTP